MLAAAQHGADAVIDAICDRLGGRVLARGPVRNRTLRTEGGFDIGSLCVGELDVGLVNEYLSVDAGGERLATFPDVLTTLSLATGLPVSIADIRDGDQMAVFHADKAQIPLGASVDPLYPEVEQMLGRPLASHALA